MRGLRKYLTPFAPDQSGAVSVFYALGGLTVIVDAGGCTGNICGFDEPRWQTGYGDRNGRVGAVFSAGLRDMDAILGRDDLLVRKLTEAAAQIRAEFIALVGTPVPAVIGTDLFALKRMTEKKTGMKVIVVPSNGMELYDKGIETALLELFKEYAKEREAKNTANDKKSGSRNIVGVIGLTPLDFFDPKTSVKLRKHLTDRGASDVYCYGWDEGTDEFKNAGDVAENLVVSPAGLESARYLQKRYGTPFRTGWPLAAADLTLVPQSAQNILIVHQQVIANAIRSSLPGRKVRAASWFMQKKELMQEGDFALRQEDDFERAVCEGGYDVIIADESMRQIVPFYQGVWIDAVHFAVSGQRAIDG